MCRGKQSAAGRSFALVIAGRQDPASAQNPVGALPEVSWDMLTASLDVGDRAAAVFGELGELGLGVTGSPTVGG
jgi:hypothetical protein